MPQKTIGITTGDPSGIGPEIIKKALRSPDLPQNIKYKILGNINTPHPSLGTPTHKSATLAKLSLQHAIQELKDNTIHAVVTAPIHKSSIHKTNFPFPGQTEFFAHHFPPTTPKNYTMIMSGKKLNIALCSIHIPLKKVKKHITSAKIIQTSILLAKFLQQKGISTPHISIAGLNPHAGEDGNIGDEETKIITPTIQKLRHSFPQFQFTGPISPDVIFRSSLDGKYDGTVCMYHDQGLIPFKLTEFENGVNTTFGLPIIRTSPDHGVALDIATQSIANPQSMISAIKLAAKLLKKKD